MRDQMVKISSSHTLSSVDPKCLHFFSQAMPNKHHAVSKPEIPFTIFFLTIVQTQPSIYVPSRYKVHEHLPFWHIHVS